MNDFIIRAMNKNEAEAIAQVLAKGYFDDKFFHWVVDNEADRLNVLEAYYSAYLTAPRAIVHVAESKTGSIIGTTVWLPHDVDPVLYENINKAVGKYAPNFQAVADLSHDSEPTGTPFYQLVGFVVDKTCQGLGVGTALLKYNLDDLDKKGIPTYLEASTEYHERSVYRKFNYERYGELMKFPNDILLYPLWRGVGDDNI